MTKNLTSSDTCFTIAAANVTLDCDGHTITGNNVAATYGVDSSQYNSTIKNCIIDNFDDQIRFVGATNGNIINNTLMSSSGTTNGACYSGTICLTSGANDNIIANNTIGNSSGLTWGIYMTFGDSGNIITDNVIASSTYSIYLCCSGTSNNLFANNTLISSVYADSCGCGNSNNNSFIGNALNVTPTSNFWVGYDIAGSTNTTIDCQGKAIYGNNGTGSLGVYSIQPGTTVKNCNINNFNYAVYLASGATDALVKDSILNTTYTNGAAIYAASGSSNFINVTGEATLGDSGSVTAAFYVVSDYNNFTNCTMISSSAYYYHAALNIRSNQFNRVTGSTIRATNVDAKSIYLFPSSVNNTLSNNTIISASSAIWLEGETTHNTVSNNFINATGGVAMGTSGSGSGVNYNTIANNTLASSSYTLYFTLTTANNTIYNNTFISPSYALVYFTSENVSGNLFYWNNFTDTSSYYVYDVGSNLYNTTINGTGEGNIWHNVVNGSINIGGNINSSGYPSLYIGTSGSGYPYNETNSLGKLFGSVVDYAPLTHTYVEPNTASVITNVITVGAVDPIESSQRIIAFNFTVDDTQGNDTINVSSATVRANNSGITRQSSSCLGVPINATAQNISCNVSLQYYDPAGVWSVNVSIEDTLGNYTRNVSTTFVYNVLYAMSLNINSLDFGVLNPGDANKTSGMLQLNNTGNFNYTLMQLKAYNLVNGSDILAASNFRINITNSTVGNVLINNTFINITGATLPRSTDTSIGNQSMYIYLDIPLGTTARKYNSPLEWTLLVS
jgi:hypothetical protein